MENAFLIMYIYTYIRTLIRVYINISIYVACNLISVYYDVFIKMRFHSIDLFERG